MKKRFLLKTMLLLCALIAGSSSVWATTVTKTVNQLQSANSWTVSSGNEIGDIVTSFSLDNNITISTSGSSNCGSIWGTDTKDWRLYEAQDGDVTVASANGYVITSITFTYNVSNSGVLKDDDTSVASGTAQNYEANSNTTSKTFTVTHSSGTKKGQVRITQFSVTYVNPSDSRAETTVTITGNETSRYMNQDASTPTATVKADETTIGEATVAWSSTNSSVATINASTGAITLVGPGSTIIKANYEGDASYKPSEASYTLNVYGVYSSISALQTATASAPYNTTTGSAAKISLSNALVTYVSGSNAYIIDEDGYGALIYESGHGFTAGNIINGNNLEVTLCLFNGATEIKGVKYTGVEISGGTVTAQTKTIGAVSAANQSMMVKFENVIYNAASSSFTDNTNSIVYVDKFSVNPTLSNGGKYDVTGLLIMDGGTLKVAPIADEDIESKLVNPTSQWKNGEDALTSITINKAAGTTSFTFETNSDGAVTYTSTNTTVATIAANGTITPVGYGTTTIKASTTATSNYNADEKSFTLNVVDASTDIIQISNVTFSGTGTGYKDWSNVSGLTTSATYAGQSNKGVEYIQIRKSTPSGIVSTTSGGRVKKVYVEWAGTNTNNRTLTIYGKNTSYSSGADLYGDGKGTSLGTIKYTTGAKSGELVIDNDKNYEYVGIYADGAAYFSILAIGWDEDLRCVETSQYEWATYVTPCALDFTDLDVKAYAVEDHSGNTLTLSSALTTVPANTPLLINADNGTYAVPIAESASPISTNKLVAGTGDAISAVGGKTRYVLSINNNGTDADDSDDFAEFQKIVGTSATVPVGKAYLEFDGDISAPSLSFDFNNSTGIENVNHETITNNRYFNLNGQRVAQPTKGLYIVNGKKVIVK